MHINTVNNMSVNALGMVHFIRELNDHYPSYFGNVDDIGSFVDGLLILDWDDLSIVSNVADLVIKAVEKGTFERGMQMWLFQSSMLEGTNMYEVVFAWHEKGFIDRLKKAAKDMTHAACEEKIDSFRKS